MRAAWWLGFALLAPSSHAQHGPSSCCGGSSRRSTLVRAPAETPVALASGWTNADAEIVYSVPAAAPASWHGLAAGRSWWSKGAVAVAVPEPVAGAGRVAREPIAAYSTTEWSAQTDTLQLVDERLAAEAEERALWRALLRAVSRTGQVAVQFRDLVGEDDHQEQHEWNASQSPRSDRNLDEDEPCKLSSSACGGSRAIHSPSRYKPEQPRRSLPVLKDPSVLSIKLGVLLERLKDHLPYTRRTPTTPLSIDPQPFRLFA